MAVLIAGNHFPEVLSLLTSRTSEYQSDSKWVYFNKIISFGNIWKSYGAKLVEYGGYIKNFDLSKNLSKFLNEKADWNYAKSTYPANDLGFLANVLPQTFWRNRFAFDNSFDIKKAD